MQNTLHTILCEIYCDDNIKYLSNIFLNVYIYINTFYIIMYFIQYGV